MRRTAAVRFAVGVAISVILLGVTLSRVDLPKTAQAIGAAAPLGLAVGVAIVLVDLVLRATRWRVLLVGVGSPNPPTLRLALGYLSVGFAANAALPARLGDIARALLAATAFDMPRLTVLGTVAVERLADGLTMLTLALLSSFLVASIVEVRQLAAFGLAVAVTGAAVLVVGWFVLARSGKEAGRIRTAILGVARRVALGAGALRSLRGAAQVAGLTVAVTLTAITVALVVARAVGVTLTPLQAVLFLSAIALSLAIPAAPGSLGTYEFVGVVVITSFGYLPEQALATMILMRVVTAFPPAICGVVALVALHIRPRTLVAGGG